MIVVTYTPPQGRPMRGIMLRRDAGSGMIEVALDSTDTRPFSIAWINPVKQIGEVTLKSNQPVLWKHKALRLVENGNIDAARMLFQQEENIRRQERARKEA
jgi:hypothetical protein